MDPYLEARDIWPDFHDALAAAIRAILNQHLPEPYYARLQKRPELGIILESGTPHRIIPDVTVLRHPAGQTEAVAAPVAMLEQPRQEASAGVDVRVYTDPFQHRFVEIRDASRGHKLITLIEIISPANKQPGPDRRTYESKQMEILSSDVQ